MASWDNQFTLGSLVPGLSETLHDLQKSTKEALDVERRAKNDIMNAINTKVQELQTAINQAELLLNRISLNLDSTGVHLLDFGAGTGGYNSFINELSSAQNKPMTPSSGYYAGTVLMVSAPDIVQAQAYFKKLKTIFTIK